MRVLHLDNNRIGDRTAFALAKSLKVNRGLSELTMLYNKVRNEGALALVEAVRGSSSMHSFALGHNPHVIGAATEALGALKEDHLTPRKFLMRHNLTDEEGGRVTKPAHPDEALERYNYHGPALHSPYAAAVEMLKPHTAAGLQELQLQLADDPNHLHTHDATAHLTEAQRHTFAELVRHKIKEEL